MTSLLLSNPNLSSPFLPQTLSRRLQQKDTTSLYYSPLQKSSRCLTVVKCSVDSPYEGKTYGGGSSPWRRRLSSFQSSVHDSDFRVRKLSSRRIQQKDTTSLFYNPIQKSSRCLTIVKCSVDSPYEGNIPTFNRTSVWDPYKRLGVSQHASEEEVWSARNFLLDQYSGHERSEESVEGAFEKLLMTSFKQRKKTKINLKTRLKKQVDESPAWVKSLVSFVEIPPMDIIFRRLFLFAFMGAWSIMNSAEGGPAFQVAVSLAACIYFLNEKTKSLGRAFVIGLGALAAGWTCGAITVPMFPAVLINPNWTLELMTSLVAYCFLFLGCTFLK